MLSGDPLGGGNPVLVEARSYCQLELVSRELRLMKEYLPITTVVFLWIWPTILIKMLSPYFDVHTQVFYLYLIGCFALIAINLVSQRRRLYNGLKEIGNIPLTIPK